MLVYISIMLISILFSLFESHIDIIEYKNKIYKTRNISFIVLFIIFLLVGVLRSDTLGVDSSNYRTYYFDFYKNETFLQVITPKFDIGYILLNWVIAKICDSFQLFCALSYALSYSLISYVIYKKSNNVGMSYLIFISIGLMFFDFNILRQAIACSICLLSLEALEKRQLKKFLVIVFIGCLFHSTALIFILLYPLADEKMLSVKMRTRFLLLLAVAVLSKVLMPRLVGLYQVNDYSSNIISGQGYNLLVYYIVFFIYIKFCLGFSEATEESYRIFESANITVYFQVMALSFSLFTRLNYYSIAILIILLPNIFDLIDNKWKNILQIPLYMFLFGFFILQISAGYAPVPYLSLFS